MNTSASHRLSMGSATALGIGAGTAIGVASDVVAFGAVAGVLAGLVMAGSDRQADSGG